MPTRTEAAPYGIGCNSTLADRPHPGLAVKVVIYSLLLVNFVLYIADDIRIDSYTSLRGAAAYWEYPGHYHFAWDEALRIIGFFCHRNEYV